MRNADLTIVVTTIPSRLDLLERSFKSWKQAIFDAQVSGRIYIYAEGFDTFPQFTTPDGDIDIEVQCGPLSGSQIAGFNYWIPRLGSPAVLFTHPEIIFPEGAIEAALKAVQFKRFAAFKAYFLSQAITDDLYRYDWNYMHEVPELFAGDPKEKGGFYSNSNIPSITDWKSNMTYVMSLPDVKDMYPYRDFGKYGYDDPWHAWRREQLGIADFTIMNPILLHQYHKNESGTIDLAEVVKPTPEPVLGGAGHMFPLHKKAQELCKGWGIEIGEGAHNPFGLSTMNVDTGEKIYQDAQIAMCGHAARIDIAADAKDIPVPDESQDFVISSHVVEHMNDTVSAFKEWDRITKPGGVIFMIHPKRDALPDDVGKPLTTLDHHIADYLRKGCDVPATAAGHWHVETADTLHALVSWMNAHEIVNWELILREDTDTKVGNGFTLAYRKTQ